MANRNETIIIDVQVTDVKKQLGETAQAIFNLKEQNKALKKEQKEGTADWAESTATIKANEAQIKLLTAAEKSLANQLKATGSENETTASKITKSNKDAAGSYAELSQRFESAAQKAKDLAAAYGSNDVRAKEAAIEAKNISDKLKEIDSSVGQNQRRVGDYAGELGKLPGAFGKAASGAGNLGASFTALKANPLFAILSVVVGLFNAISNAMGSGTESGRKLQQVMAPLNDLFKGLVKIMADFFSVVLSGAAAIAKFVGNVLSFIPAIENMNKASEESIRIEKEKQRLLREGMLDKAADAKEELRLADLRKKINQADKYTVEQRLAFAREVDKSEKQMALDDANRANNNLKNFLKNMELQGKAQKDYSDEEMQQLVDLQTAKYNEQQAYYDKTRKTASREAALIAEIESEKNAKIEADNKAAQERREETEKRRIENIGKYVDAELRRLNELARVAEEKRLLAKKAVDDAEAAFKSQIERLNAFAKRNSDVELQAFNDLQFAKRVLAENTISEMANLDREALADEYRQRIANAEAAGRDTTLIEQAYSEERKRINQAETAAKIELAGQAMGALSAIFGEGSKAGKAFAAAQVAIDTYKGALSAFAAGMQLGPIAGPIVGGILAAGVTAKGAKAIKDIYAVKQGQKTVSKDNANSTAASSAASTVSTPATKGADLVLNSGQAGSLNGKIAAAQPASGGIDYDLLAKSMSKQPAPVMVYSEFKSFETKVTGFDEQTKI